MTTEQRIAKLKPLLQSAINTNAVSLFIIQKCDRICEKGPYGAFCQNWDNITTR